DAPHSLRQNGGTARRLARSRFPPSADRFHSMKAIKLFVLCLLGLALSIAGHPVLAAMPHYVGELIDGTKIKGDQLTGIQEAPSAWKLDGTPLFGENPLR